MSVIMLFIARESEEHISLHDDDGSALDALVRYVDNHWDEAQLAQDVSYSDPALRIEAWFKATQALYVISEASLHGE